MLLAFFFVTCLMLCLMVIGYRQYMHTQRDPVAEATLFETRIDPPFVRPVVTRLEDGDLMIDAPVVHARLVGEILVLDIKSTSGRNPEGFELALTNFDKCWLTAEKYAYHPCKGHLLVGPQGPTTDRLLRRTARTHDIDLPNTAGERVQAFALEGVVTDPGDFRIEFQAHVPTGAPIHIAYDYAKASVHVRLHASIFAEVANLQPLKIRMEEEA